MPPEPAEILELSSFENTILEQELSALTEFGRDSLPAVLESEDKMYAVVCGLSSAKLPVYMLSGNCFSLTKSFCNIPPHNLAEIVDALDAKLQNSKAQTSDLLTAVRGPDFACGGTVIFRDEEARKHMYSAGKGAYTFKCDYSIVERTSDLSSLVFKVIDGSYALKELNLAIEHGVVSGIQSAFVSEDDVVELLLERSSELENTSRIISDLPGFSIELVYNSTLVPGRRSEKCEQLPLEGVLELFIESRIKYLRKFHRCSRQEAVNLYSAELANFKSKYSKPRLTKILYSEM